jgi:hypothetical protein
VKDKIIADFFVFFGVFFASKKVTRRGRGKPRNRPDFTTSLEGQTYRRFVSGGGGFLRGKKSDPAEGGMREGRGGGIKLEIALTSRTICKDKFIADFFLQFSLLAERLTR